MASHNHGGAACVGQAARWKCWLSELGDGEQREKRTLGSLLALSLGIFVQGTVGGGAPFTGALLQNLLLIKIKKENATEMEVSKQFIGGAPQRSQIQEMLATSEFLLCSAVWKIRLPFQVP